MEESLDKIDKAILNIVQSDSTISVKEIGDKVGLSTTPTYERIKRLEKDGVISKYVALVDRNKVGLGFMAYCNIVLKERSKKTVAEFEKSVSRIQEIIEVQSVSGTYDYMLKVVVPDIKSYNHFVTTVMVDIPHVAQCHSCIVLSEVKKVTNLKIT